MSYSDGDEYDLGISKIPREEQLKLIQVHQQVIIVRDTHKRRHSSVFCRWSCMEREPMDTCLRGLAVFGIPAHLPQVSCLWQFLSERETWYGWLFLSINKGREDAAMVLGFSKYVRLSSHDCSRLTYSRYDNEDQLHRSQIPCIRSKHLCRTEHEPMDVSVHLFWWLSKASAYLCSLLTCRLRL